jgi:hypothetical protein
MIASYMVYSQQNANFLRGYLINDKHNYIKVNAIYSYMNDDCDSQRSTFFSTPKLMSLTSIL